MSSLSRPRAILFDWDNTLVDTWPVIHDALNTTFRAFNVAEWTMDETRKKVRHSMRDSFPGIFGDEWEKAGEVFYARYAEIHATGVVPADGAARLLQIMEGQGIYMGVVSNKRGDYLRKEADQLGWTPFFGALVGANDALHDKPNPAPVHMSLSAGGYEPGPDVWFVGDADIDMTCAANAGCTAILVHPEADAYEATGKQIISGRFASCDHLCNSFLTM